MKMIFYLIFSSGYPYSSIFEDFCEADVYIVCRLACVACLSCYWKSKNAVLVYYRDLKYAHSYTEPISWLLETVDCVIWRELRLEICVEADVWDVVAVTFGALISFYKVEVPFSKIQPWEMVLGGLGFSHSPAQLIKVFCLMWLLTVSPYEL